MHLELAPPPAQGLGRSLSLALVVFGVVGYLRLPISDLPSIDFPTLLARGDWSTGERLMVKAAASVFGCRPDGNHTVGVNLLDVRAGLDEANRRAVFEAVEMAL